MNFGLDHDGTFTVAPREFYHFVLSLHKAGHSVFLTTMRYPSEEDSLHPLAKSLIEARVLTPIYTSRMAKAPACRKRGIHINVWIDDFPQAVHFDATSIWNEPAPEGSPVVNDHLAPPA